MGLSFEKIMLLLLLAAVIIGPERLPLYTKKLAEFIASVKRLAGNAKTQLQEEMGDEFNEIDWKQYDPRQYDPRRIIKDALTESDQVAAQRAAREAGKQRAKQAPRSAQVTPDGSTVVAASSAALVAQHLPVPFDSEAT